MISLVHEVGRILLHPVRDHCGGGYPSSCSFSADEPVDLIRCFVKPPMIATGDIGTHLSFRFGAQIFMKSVVHKVGRILRCLARDHFGGG